MAIVIALPGFNDLGCSATPIFLMMDRFLYQCFKFSKKGRKSIDYKFDFFAKPTIESRSS